MKTILFVILPTSSHYMASFPLANALKRKGYNVIFTGNSTSIRSIVVANGFQYVGMEYQTVLKIKNLKLFFSLFLVSILYKKFLFERYKEFYFNVLEVRKIEKITNANFIFVDEHLHHYYFYFKSTNNKVYLINTKLSTRYSKNSPPLNSLLEPNKSIQFKLLNRLAWVKIIMRREIKSIIFKIAFWGADDEFFLQKFCKKNNINYKAHINKKNTFYYGLKNVKRIILAPECLELSMSNSNDVYIFLEDERNEDALFVEEYKALKEKLTNDNRKTILCSFGTLVKESDKEIFLNKLNAAIDVERYNLVVVSKNINIISNKNKNVFIIRSLPQIDFLKCCDLMLHHGGFNTIKECLQFQVPMLIYALKKRNYDWLGNATRVKWKSLGLVGDIYNDCSDQISINISKALELKMPKHDFEKEYLKLDKFINEEMSKLSKPLESDSGRL